MALRFAAEMHNREIAEIMGRSEGAVKLLTFRALTTLRKRFGAPLPDGSARRAAGTAARPTRAVRRSSRPGMPRAGHDPRAGDGAAVDDVERLDAALNRQRIGAGLDDLPSRAARPGRPGHGDR